MTDPTPMTSDEIKLVEMVAKYKELAKLFIRDVKRMDSYGDEISFSAVGVLYKCCDKLNVFLEDYEQHL